MAPLPLRILRFGKSPNVTLTQEATDARYTRCYQGVASSVQRHTPPLQEKTLRRDAAKSLKIKTKSEAYSDTQGLPETCKA